MRILIADDEQCVRKLIAMIMEERGYATITACNGREAVQLCAEYAPDMIILDVMMPQIDGFEACSQIRALDPTVPVLFLSAKGDVVDRKTGLRMGADDYLAKPFDEEELVLRVEALLRRKTIAQQTSAPSTPAIFTRGNFVFDQKRLVLTFNQEPVALTTKEFQILCLLAHDPGQVISNEEIIATIWGNEYLNESVSVPVYMRRIRNKIEENPSKPQYVRTVRGSGYYFVP